MSFIETPRFPDDVSYGATGGPGYMTDVVIVNSGAESRNQNWSQARARYDVSHGATLPAQYEPLRAFFRAMKGRTHGFRFKDWTDFDATTTTGLLGTGVGTAGPTYQLIKNYAAGALSEARPITKPVAASVKIYRATALQTAGTAPGNYALDSTTGVVTFVPDAAQTISSVTEQAVTTILNLAAPLTGAAAGKRVYLTGLAGDGIPYNDASYVITNVVSNAVYITLDSAGQTWNNQGTASMYPQTTEAMTWSGEFDVPCRFDTDSMVAEAISRSGTQLVISWASIPIVEIRV